MLKNLSVVSFLMTYWSLVICSSENGELITASVVKNRASGDEGHHQLILFLLQIFRHGDRTPVEPYPLDPWKDQKWWPVGFGQLTNVSKSIFLSYHVPNIWKKKIFDVERI